MSIQSGIRSDRRTAWRTMNGSLWHYTRGSDQDKPPRKKCKKAKWLPEEALQIDEKTREAKGKGEKERYTQWNVEFQRIAKKDKEVFLSDQCKEIEENNTMGKTRDLFRKIRDTKGIFHAKTGTIKDRNGMDLIEAEDIKKGGKNTQKNHTKKTFMIQKTMMVWSLT